MDRSNKWVPFGEAKIIAASSHRNGISGAPFHVVLFEDRGEDGSRKIGIRFEPGAEGCHCAVLDVNKLAAGDIAFMSNSWRGDLFEPMLRAVGERIDQEEQWRPVFGPDYWEQQAPGQTPEAKGTHHATQTEEPGNHEEDRAMSEKEKVENGNARRPEAKLACGSVRGNVWSNHSKQGGEHFTLSIACLHKAPDGSMKATPSFLEEDFPDLLEVIEGAGKIIQEESLKRGLEQPKEMRRLKISR